MDFLSKHSSCLSNWQMNLQPGWQTLGASVLLAAGGLFLVSKAFVFVRVILSLFVLPGKPLRSFGPKGSWAVVTGASDGLGKEFAIQLARANFNILLVSRTASKLDTLRDELKAKFPSVQTKTLAMDFARNQDSDYEKLKALVDELDVAVLVNNVGKSHSIPTPFALTPEDELTDIVTINCLGTLRATQLVVPGMIQRKRGLIMTMGSFGGLLPTPLLATYSGSKAFLQQWSTSLGSELEPHGITVELVQAYLITSAMSKIRRASATIPNPRNFVKAVLSKIGRNGGSPSYAYSSSPYWSHGLMAWFLTSVTGTMGKFVVGQNKGMHEAIRKRALRKAEREKGKKST
ncbi:NAD(P)-binding protein [Aspergillus heteromorphus CBS 117.55]|uniref:Very-long-chain 3-oxoacyl-CoA reductase n=1 Tax=Aspergillus heteromorphus CBS 117.55 TaxID=1448321 RepID=A0A317VKW1_9EURO|nr:NAD(P)-binding protein [Aspergillus heteromorphus CBS 117.55]PWY73568.1 NAD(P)-binding protein [Aspergillus heteromorphus CBS 117.55]